MPPYPLYWLGEAEQVVLGSHKHSNAHKTAPIAQTYLPYLKRKINYVAGVLARFNNSNNPKVIPNKTNSLLR